MRIIAIANQKGGCAKTTTVVSLAACLAELKYRVLVVDLDPQANASRWLGVDEDHHGSLQLLAGDSLVVDLITPSAIKNVSLINGSQGLAEIDKFLAGKLAVESTLSRKLKKIDENGWDFILIDTPPTLGLLTINALTAANELLVPVTTHVMTLSGVAQLTTTVENVLDILNPNLRILGYLPCRFDGRTRHSQDVFESLVGHFGSAVFQTKIRENIRIAEAPSFRESILAYDPKSTVAQDYRDFAKEVLGRAVN